MFSKREVEGGFVLMSDKQLDESGFATINRIEGTAWMLQELEWPNQVINFLIHQHLRGRHQLRFAFPKWVDFSDQEDWLKSASEENPPDYAKFEQEKEKQ